jgi:WD40 repeat protein
MTVQSHYMTVVHVPVVKVQKQFVFALQTQKVVRVYDLAKQELVKKLHSNSKWISSIAIHPGNSFRQLLHLQ